MKHFPVYPNGGGQPPQVKNLTVALMIDREILEDLLLLKMVPLCGWVTGQMPPPSDRSAGLAYAFKSEVRERVKSGGIGSWRDWDFTHDLRDVECSTCRVLIDRELERGNAKNFGVFLFLLSLPEKIKVSPNVVR